MVRVVSFSLPTQPLTMWVGHSWTSLSSESERSHLHQLILRRCQTPLRSRSRSTMRSLASCSFSEPQLTPNAGPSDGVLSIGVLRHVPLEVAAELGRAKVTMEEILRYGRSIIELDRTAGSPVDVVVNGSMVAEERSSLSARNTGASHRNFGRT